MFYHDISQFYAVFTDKVQHFFIDNKIAKVVFGLSILILVWYLGALLNLYIDAKNWPESLAKLSHDIQTIDKSNNKDSTNILELSLSNKKSITNKYLFGETTKPGSTLSDALKSGLPFKLKGLITDVDPKLGSAIIADSNGDEKSYNPGDKLPITTNDVTLEYIFKGKVFIKNDDTLEFIEYPKLELKNMPREQSTTPITESLPNSEPTDNNFDGEINSKQLLENLSRQKGNVFKFNKLSKYNKFKNRNKRNYN